MSPDQLSLPLPSYPVPSREFPPRFAGGGLAGRAGLAVITEECELVHMLIGCSCFLLTTRSCLFALFCLAARGLVICRRLLPILGPQSRCIKHIADLSCPSLSCLWGLRAVSPSLPRRDLFSQSGSGPPTQAQQTHPGQRWPHLSRDRYFLVAFGLYISTFSCHLGYNFRRVPPPPYFVQGIATGALRGVIRIYHLSPCQKRESPASFARLCSNCEDLLEKQCSDPQGSGPLTLINKGMSAGKMGFQAFRTPAESGCQGWSPGLFTASIPDGGQLPCTGRPSQGHAAF